LQEHVYTISEVCSKFGIEHAVICPGSRSAPLVFAFTQNKKINCYSITDERSAAFVALGMAQKSKNPVVLICTSGTAAVNFYPAIAEAFYQHIPLIILTADRPPELLNQQDGQMIFQDALYGNHVLAAYNLPCFTQNNNDFDLSENITAEAISICNSAKQKGPVHINIPFVEPLYPDTLEYEVNLKSGIKLKEFTEEVLPKDEDLDLVKEVWKSCAKKIILIGQLQPDDNLKNGISELCKREDVVVFSDITSNQNDSSNCKLFDFIISHCDKEFLNSNQPDLLISIGGPVLSKALENWFKKAKIKHHFRVQSENTLVDTYGNVSKFIKSDPKKFISELSKKFTTYTSQKPFITVWQNANLLAKNAISSFLETENWSELVAMQKVLDKLPVPGNLHLANSSGIRYASLLGINQSGINCYANRGTSGIDGCTSTAVGSAFVSKQITTLISGDLAFFYDSNAFWNNLVRENLRVVIFNNKGGGIFSLIEGPTKFSETRDFFIAPHNRNAKNIANDYNLEYYICTNFSELNTCLKGFFNESKRPKLLELNFSIDENSIVFKEFRKLKIS